ncbi:MAG: DNA helicase RecQ [Solobacterium sp.]|nr:DNA helicase RecQ [Solobacterium sp.]
MRADEILKTYFGYDSFRTGQREIVEHILSSRDVLAVMPTGAGKSICYQVPAMCMDGITLVVSPLISLMKDQVSALVSAGIPAAYLNSSLTAGQFFKALNNLQNGKYKIVYIAPERLLTERFLECVSHLKISMLAVDEAHCISQWGNNFRPDYLKIAQFLNMLRQRPVVSAFTATATQRVKKDIVEILGLNDPFTLTTGFDRPNLYFGVIDSKDKDADLLKLLRQYKDRSGIVYCSTRAAVEEVCELLISRKYSAVRYHAGLSEEERRKNQDAFSMDQARIIVATNAFGMGIDKSNVSFVIHYHMPMSMEAYYQEAGRAGRDGEPADCVLLYSPADVRLNRFLIEHSEPNPAFTKAMQEEIQARDLERLKKMSGYAKCGGCLREYILKYFGEKTKRYCGNCSGCKTNFIETDITVDAQKILSALIRTNQMYGAGMIVDILMGTRTERIKEKGLDQLSVYGIMKDAEKSEIEGIIRELSDQSLIRVTDDQFRVLKADPSAVSVLKGEKKVTRMIRRESARTVRTDTDPLIAALRKLRQQLAENEHVPAYVVFSDATLKQIAQRKPLTKGKLKEIQGMGKKKVNKYGARIIRTVKNTIE